MYQTAWGMLLRLLRRRLRLRRLLLLLRRHLLLPQQRVLLLHLWLRLGGYAVLLAELRQQRCEGVGCCRRACWPRSCLLLLHRTRGQSRGRGRGCLRRCRRRQPGGQA